MKSLPLSRDPEYKRKWRANRPLDKAEEERAKAREWKRNNAARVKASRRAYYWEKTKPTMSPPKLRPLTARQAAKAAGETSYAGAKCKNCDGITRYVSTGGCVACNVAGAKKRQAQNGNAAQIRWMKEWAKTPNGKIVISLRNRLYKAVKRNQKTGSAVRDLGCSVEQFKEFISGKFLDGMSWANHGKWHLDHIQPLAAFDLSDRCQLLKAVHYSNYQPLWAENNHRKGARGWKGVRIT
jgi:hypothetical protein